MLKSAKFILKFAILAAIMGGDRAWAQDTAKSKDDALDSLMKELRESEKAAGQRPKPGTAQTQKRTSTKEK